MLGVRRYCLMEATTEAEWDLPDGLTGFSLSRGNARMTLVRPTTFQTEPGVCTVGGRALMRLQWYNLFGNPNIPIVESRADFEFCDAVTIACPPIGQGEWLVDAVGRVPTPTSLTRSSGTHSSATPGRSTRLPRGQYPRLRLGPAMAVRRRQYIYTLTEERYDPDFGPPGGLFVRRLLARLTFRARFRSITSRRARASPRRTPATARANPAPASRGPRRTSSPSPATRTMRARPCSSRSRTFRSARSSPRRTAA